MQSLQLANKSEFIGIVFGGEIQKIEAQLSEREVQLVQLRWNWFHQAPPGDINFRTRPAQVSTLT